MILSRNIRYVAAIAAASAAFAGCGGDGDGDANVPQGEGVQQTTQSGGDGSSQGSSPAQQAQATPEPESPADKEGATAEVKWAAKLCNALGDETDRIDPPNTGGNPQDQTEALASFFSSVTDQLGNQVDTLEQVGPPPGSKAASDFESTVSDLKRVRRRVNGVAGDLRDTTASNQQEFARVMTRLGEQLQTLNDYRGPIPELQKSKTLAKAIQEEPACSQFT